MNKKKLFIPLVAAVIVTAIGISTNTYAATRVAHSIEAKSGKHSRNGVVGMVSSISNSTITLISQNSTTYSIDASKAEILKANLAPTAPSVVSVNDIKNGDMLLVQGIVNGSSVQATTILDGKLFDKSSRGAEGTISSISGSTLSIIGKDNLRYTIEATNAKIFKNFASIIISIADLKVGDKVLVRRSLAETSIIVTKSIINEK